MAVAFVTRCIVFTWCRRGESKLF